MFKKAENSFIFCKTLSGLNGSGKSNILDAICFVMGINLQNVGTLFIAFKGSLLSLALVKVYG